ncbi:phage/plasmid primase, P4 family [Tritonibacter scottomollicae]|uniref:Phage/plasmid primase, P4 family n=1 Tax=Tritonibacter scottomollicae TaxID=483013 RepID=A0ABZ0HFZ2_TRISK|nr:phage/plasmid primase, P4 family [Tritonibacter scottomollicae]WOI32866.1 phage/plasmid primase, P4 family [Tritonibacter scottomollicae]
MTNDNGIHTAFAQAEKVDMGTPDAADMPQGDDGPKEDRGSPLPPHEESPPDDAYLEDKPEAKGASFPLTDYGNGQRLIHYFGRDFVWVPRLGWYRWDGRRWQADEDEILVRRDAQQISDRILHEIPFVALDDWQRDALDLWREVKAEYRKLIGVKVKDRAEGDAERLEELEGIREKGVAAEKAIAGLRKSHRDHARASGNSSKISNMLQEAQPAKAVRVDDLNADKLALCVENGVLRFSMVEDEHAAEWGEKAQLVPRAKLEDHDRADMITKMVRAKYDPGATCPTFLAFLKRILPEREIRDFMQRWCGYNLTGLTTEQKLAFLFGGGRNGKSTLMDLIGRIMDDYGTTIPIETLTGSEQRKGSDATPDLVRLPGARYVRASEPEQGQKMKEALIKSLTGGEAIMIRRMMQEFVEVVPEFKLTIGGNYRPEVRGADDGIWRRIMLVPFLQQIPQDEVDPLLPQKLWAERDGILSWMVQGALDWMQGGLRPPEAILEATADYRLTSDPVRQFLEDECEITGSPEDDVMARIMNDAFNAWQLDNGNAAWTSRHLSNQMLLRVGAIKGPNGETFERVKSSNYVYRGVRLKQDALTRLDVYRERLEARK